MNCLWVVDAASGDERLLADPAELIVDDVCRSARCRAGPPRTYREAAAGITSYAIDREGTCAAFALAGRLFVCDVISGVTRELTVDNPVFDPRPDPDGRRVAYVGGHVSPRSTARRASRTLELDTTDARALAHALAPLARERGVRLYEVQPLDADLEGVFRYVVQR